MAGGGLLDEALFADHEDGGYVRSSCLFFHVPLLTC